MLSGVYAGVIFFCKSLKWQNGAATDLRISEGAQFSELQEDKDLFDDLDDVNLMVAWTRDSKRSGEGMTSVGDLFLQVFSVIADL